MHLASYGMAWRYGWTQKQCYSLLSKHGHEIAEMAFMIH
jgi:hypothetical protein